MLLRINKSDKCRAKTFTTKVYFNVFMYLQNISHEYFVIVLSTIICNNKLSEIFFFHNVYFHFEFAKCALALEQ